MGGREYPGQARCRHRTVAHGPENLPLEGDGQVFAADAQFQRQPFVRPIGPGQGPLPETGALLRADGRYLGGRILGDYVGLDRLAEWLLGRMALPEP